MSEQQQRHLQRLINKAMAAETKMMRELAIDRIIRLVEKHGTDGVEVVFSKDGAQ